MIWTNDYQTVNNCTTCITRSEVVSMVCGDPLFCQGLHETWTSLSKISCKILYNTKQNCWMLWILFNVILFSLMTELTASNKIILITCIRSRGWHSYTFTTVIRWTRLKTKTKVCRFFVFIRKYAQICLYMKRHDLCQSPTELSWRHFFFFFFCKVGLNYSSASIKQLLNTKKQLLTITL